MSEIIVEKDLEAISEAAAKLFVSLARDAIAARGRFTVSLAGGSTPASLYKLLASKDFAHTVNWSSVYIFFGDERFVPRASPESNFRMANESLFRPAGISAENIFGFDTFRSPEYAAAEYEDQLRKFFSLEPDQLPTFDLMLLGIGDDGHTASLFPHTDALHESSRLTAANYVGKLDTTRLTLTFPTILNSRSIVAMVSGTGKAEALAAVMSPGMDVDTFPAGRLNEAGRRMLWIVDQAAAGLLVHN